MNAFVFRGVGDVRLDDVPEPAIEEPTDATVSDDQAILLSAIVPTGYVGADLTEVEPMRDAVAAYEAFDRRQPGWIKVELEPAGA